MEADDDYAAEEPQVPQPGAAQPVDGDVDMDGSSSDSSSSVSSDSSDSDEEGAAEAKPQGAPAEAATNLVTSRYPGFAVKVKELMREGYGDDMRMTKDTEQLCGVATELFLRNLVQAAENNAARAQKKTVNYRQVENLCEQRGFQLLSQMITAAAKADAKAEAKAEATEASSQGSRASVPQMP
eukprot:TRINITY_DN23003_c0_g1_i1.p2 TRINITY_DN23003_c0_g1~~TRINITY_DN23003_c0_g1_i1.p2  ORF type:complete len:213 (+),score=82.36 TRINITY_DN23003_c0_g1_i1:93-641(+)